MKQKLFFLLVTTFLVTSCAVPVATTPTFVDSRPIETQTAQIPSEAAAPTETIEIPTPQIFSDRFVQLDMLDELFGTAHLMGNDGTQTLVVTQDGGKTWTSIMPLMEGYILSTYFSSSRNGLLTTQSQEGKTSLWSTSDGGVNWQNSELVENMVGARLNLVQGEYLLARVEDVGAGSAYVHYYESTDMGKTWSLLPLIPPEAEEGLPEGIVRICNICGDLTAQTELNSLIVHGEMANEAKNTITLDVTNERGVNWRRVEIPKPSNFEAFLTHPIYLNLGDARWLVLLSLVQFDPIVSSQIFVLESQDQGLTWNIYDPNLQLQSVFTASVIKVNEEMLALICEGEVCLLGSSAPTLTKISLNKIWENEDSTSDLLLEFTDRQHAWLVINSPKKSNIYQTSDGGENWDLIKSNLIEVSP